MNIGVLGGTFDPIHNGHIIVAEGTRDQLNLAEVLFMPAGQPWLKEDCPVLSVEHRVQMLRLALADEPYFKMSTMETARAGPSYTVDTMIELQAQLSAGDKLFFILGWDNLAQLPRWREPSRLIQICHLVAVLRPGYPFPDLKSLETVIPGLSQRLIILEKIEVDIDATGIRKRVAQGLSIRHLVPEPVDEYIRQYKLYLTN
ncbi:nicotinate-nucleotide adenylyltransferase [Chloroflexota bacterium]